MSDCFDRMRKSAYNLFDKAGTKAGEVVEVGKLKAKVSSKKNDVYKAKKELGDYCYDLYISGKTDDVGMNEICARIDSCLKDIDDLDKQIADAKAAASEDPTI